MPDLKVRLSPKHRALIKRRVDSGEFASADAYVQQLLNRDAKRDHRLSLEKKLLGRLDQKNAIEMDDADFARLRRKFMSAISDTSKKS